MRQDNTRWSALRSILCVNAFALLATVLVACSSDSENEPVTSASQVDEAEGVINLLFIGHEHRAHEGGFHLSHVNASLFNQSLGREKIFMEYVENLDRLTDEGLANVDAVMLYANYRDIEPEQEKALLDFVEQGGAFLPIHSASACFGRSDAFVKLVGGRFASHGAGDFTATIVEEHSQHPLIEGFEPFATWDETYVHSDHNEQGRTVLMEREQEPWTWVREQGEGRVFYTAYGHNEKTWSQPAFHDLLIRGILWSVGDDKSAANRALVATLPEGEYRGALTIPNYRRVEPEPQFQEAFSVEDSMALTMAPQEFELKLFVSEPDIVNPVAFTWDERGRLFVVESVDYPNGRVDSGDGNDRVSMCEDTDIDGQADKCEVFADNLSVPTGIVAYDGGFVVSQAPDFLFLKDTTGDGKADLREVISSGWGTRDTHAGPSNLNYGHDNRLWGAVGYSQAPPDANGEELRNGIYRMNFDGSELQPVGQLSNNTWGVAFNEEFDVFGSTANGAPVWHIPLWRNYVQGRYSEVAPQMASEIDNFSHVFPATYNFLQVDQHGRYTAGSGLNIYTAREFPQEFWNKGAFIGEPTAHLLGQFFLESQDGSADYKANNRGSIITSTDEWFSPVHMDVGPDGQLWVADWYNFIIQHNPIPTKESAGFDAEEGSGNAHVNPLRDRKRGRIYRLVAKQSEPYQPLNLSDATTAELVQALSNDNMFWRLTAQRKLVTENRLDATDSLRNILLSKPALDAIGLDVASIHAIWTLQGLGAFTAANDESTTALQAALSHSSGATRKNAVQALVQNGTPEDLALAAQSLSDEDPRARLWALLAISMQAPSQAAGELLFSLRGELPTDEWSAQAFKLAALNQEAFYWDALNQAPAAGDLLKHYKSYEQTPEYSVTKRMLTKDSQDLSKTLQSWQGLPSQRLLPMSLASLQVWRERGVEPSAAELAAFQSLVDELDSQAQMALKLHSSGLGLTFAAVDADEFEQYRAGFMFEPRIWGWGSASQGKELYMKHCAGCHGDKAGGDYAQSAPPLAGISNEYAQAQLQKFHAGVRGTHFKDPNGMTMRAALEFLQAQVQPDRSISSLAHYLEELPKVSTAAVVEGRAEQGAKLYASCVACHGVNGEGNIELGAPALAGQADWYLLQQLKNYRSGARGADPRDTTGQQMAVFANMLQDEQALQDVVAHIRTLSAEQ